MVTPQFDRAMKQITRWWGAAMLLAALAACGGGGGGGGAPDTNTGTAAPTGQVVSTSIDSTKTGASYPIQIWVPDSYATDTAAYPTIYALDGDATFVDSATRFSHFQAILQKHGTHAILVGIGGTARRQTDYNFPGAYAYHDFVALELIPYVESRFRADPHRRALSGLSTSANFAATALFIEAPSALVFSHFLSTEGAFWQQQAMVNDLEQQMFDALAGRSLPVTLLLAHGVLNASVGTNAAVVEALYDTMAARAYVGLNLVETAFPTGHADTDDPAFEDAVARFFN
jgi:predicted alpha/beta superfamily hydrolase